MTLDQVREIVNTVLDIGTPGVLVLMLLSMWKGWVVPQREVNDLHETIKTQAETITLLESSNDRLLNEISKPLQEVLSTLPPTTMRRK